MQSGEDRIIRGEVSDRIDRARKLEVRSSGPCTVISRARRRLGTDRGSEREDRCRWSGKSRQGICWFRRLLGGN